MHLTRMRLGGVPPFTEPVEFEFDERVNVFVGPNASGKSTALRLLQGQREIGTRFDFQLSDGWLSEAQRVATMPQQGRASSPVDSRKEGVNLMPWIYLPAVRTAIPFSFDADAMAALQSQGVPVMFIDDAIEESEGRIKPIDLSYVLRNDGYHFNGLAVHKAWNMIMNRVRRGVSSNDNISVYEETAVVAFKCSLSICPEILMSDGVPIDYIHRLARNGVSVTSVHDKMAIQTTDGYGSNLFVGDLSAGTQGTLLWIWYVALKMADFYKNQRQFPPRNDGEWQNKPAILLIDEIENHLHPTWQRRVIPALLEHFPGLQIFATTHSPFVVAGLRAGQVHMLKRDADGVVTYSPNEQDIIGWTTDEILRTFMGVDEPTDQLTINRRERLLELRRKDSLSDAEAAEMEELRRQVNEDFLSSVTPLGRERERLGDMMMEFLRSRQSDLSQDGD